MLTGDPHRFRGRLGATYGPDLENRETTTELGDYVDADAAINAGWTALGSPW